MANDRMTQFRYSYENQVCDIFARISIGATGAPTLVATVPNPNQGIVSIVRNSAGRYTLTLKSNFGRLMMLKHVFLNATAPAAPGMYIISDNSASATPTIVLQFNSGGTSTDPGSGEVMMLQLSLKNSSV